MIMMELLKINNAFSSFGFVSSDYHVTALSYGFYTKAVEVKDSCIRQTNLITNYMKLLMYEFGAIVFSASNFEQDFYWKISDLVWWIFVWNSMQLFPKWWLSLPSLILFSYSNLTSHVLILLPHCSKLHIHTLMNRNKNLLLLWKKIYS